MLIRISKITSGEGPLGKVYERLRKRSYRLYRKYPVEISYVCHQSYVAGVRDALKEVNSEIVIDY